MTTRHLPRAPPRPGLLPPGGTDPLGLLTMLVMHSTPTAVLVHSVASLYGNAEDEVRPACEMAPCGICSALHTPHCAAHCRMQGGSTASPAAPSQAVVVLLHCCIGPRRPP